MNVEILMKKMKNKNFQALGGLKWTPYATVIRIMSLISHENIQISPVFKCSHSRYDLQRHPPTRQ